MKLGNLVDYAGMECCGCGRTTEEIAYEDNWTDEDFDSCSKTTTCGNWYCHIDCFRDSR